MKTFYFYENSRKRYTASYNAGEQIHYTVEYRVKVMGLFGRSYYSWKEVASMSSMKKFDAIKPLLDIKMRDDLFIKAERRKITVNPFLEYQEHHKYSKR